MASETTANAEQVEQLYAFVANEMRAGADKASIAAKLQEGGLERSSAEQLTDQVYRDITKMVEEEAFTAGGLLPAVVGGLAAALIGAAVWAAIAFFANYEVGFVAWGIGALCGFAVVLATSGSKGRTLQIVAVVTSILGIALGKYAAFFYTLKDIVAQEEGPAAAAQLSMLSPELMAYFVELLPEMASPFDLLWIILAVGTAWSIPRASGIRVASSQGPIGQ